MSTRSVRVEDPDAQPPRSRRLVDPERAAGWVVFAAILLILAGGLNVLDGIIGLSKSSFYAADARYIFSDLNTWSWIVLAIGVAEVAAGLTVMAGNQLARWFGIGVASLNAVAQLGFVQAYPYWSLAIFALDVLVIYALAVYGDRVSLDV
jgi:hypothetical protein